MIIVPGGLFMYGWAAQAQVQFVVPLIGAGIFAIGVLMAYVSSLSRSSSTLIPRNGLREDRVINTLSMCQSALTSLRSA